MKTPPGKYRIDYFNRFDEYVKSDLIIALSIQESHTIAKLQLGKPGRLYAGYTVMLCVFNSTSPAANL